jgi:hypothetical protein
MANEVLSGVYERWKRKTDAAYAEARSELEDRILGKLVQLRYPKEEGEEVRTEKVGGRVADVDVGTILADGVEFAVWVELEGGKRYVDPESITVLEQEDPEDRSWRRVGEELPPKQFPGTQESVRVEVKYDLGGRSVDYYDYEEELWGRDLTSLHETGMRTDGKVTHWKPLEPGPNE